MISYFHYYCRHKEKVSMVSIFKTKMFNNAVFSDGFRTCKEFRRCKDIRTEDDDSLVERYTDFSDFLQGLLKTGE